MEDKRKIIKRRNFGVKTRKIGKYSGSKGANNSSNSSGAFDRSGLKHKNRILAATLNSTRLENAALCQKLNQLKGEMLELRGEIAQLKRDKQTLTASARTTESEIRREIIHPIKRSLQQALNNALGLTDNLTNSISLLESLQRHNDKAHNRLSDDLTSSWFQRSTPGQLRQTPQATVSPRVMGYEILKPKIKISRLDMSALNVPEIRPEQDNNVDTTNSAPDADNRNDRNADDEEEEEEPSILIRSRRRRPQRNIPEPPNMGVLEENSEEEGREEMVLLFPRLVLDRIRLTPTRTSSRRQSEDPEPRPSTSTARQSPAPETPRARESFDDFTRRVGGLDPMEGPSWLFDDDEQESGTTVQKRPAKSREEKRQENSLKARLSSASRKLSLENEDGDEGPLNEEEQPTESSSVVEQVEQPKEEEEPRRRGGARAAAKAAAKSLKEPPMNTKLRQGDPVSKSVYDDFVPGTKRKSDRKSSKGGKKKKSS